MLLDGLYILSFVSMIAGLILAIRAWHIRKQVMGRYSSDMGKLEDWERALRYTSSGNEEEIKIALDIMWALSNPFTYSEIQPVVNMFVNHGNKEISIRAHRILDKHVASLPKVSEIVISDEAAPNT